MAVDTLLIEIGTEELPPKSLNRLRLSLLIDMQNQLDEADLSYSGLQCHATSRRLGLVIENLANQQPDQHFERRGPAIKVAYDDDGSPSKALVGFMQSCGVEDPSELDTLQTKKGEWLVYRAIKPGASLHELLPEMLKNALAALPIERQMRWGTNREEFVRPVKWLVSLYGGDELPINLFGFKSGRLSNGHRFMSKGEFEIRSADSYVDLCRDNFILVDFEKRRQDILNDIKAIAVTKNAELELDPELVDEVTALVEWPVALSGVFDEAFLNVPSEVLISVMKKHQRYFHLFSNGQLLPSFITIANIESSDPAVVISGNEKVIQARLADAAFFYNKDTKTSLETKLDRLGSVVFQSELGSYGEKARRLSELAGYIAGKVEANAELARQAGLLAKVDLVSDLVIEFPDLQGIMGGYYALYDKLSNEVAKGISQHYRPTKSGTTLPEGPIASSVALADKIDTLTGLFGIGQPPTGSKDPFALRRQALGVIRICIENRLSVDLLDCFAKSSELYERELSTRSVLDYIRERLDGYYNDLGINKGVVNAALGGQTRSMNLLRLNYVIQALHDFESSDIAKKVITANKRVANLLKKSDLSSLPTNFDKNVATKTEELELHQALNMVDLTLITSETEQLEILASLQNPIDTFFEKVMVMDDDAKLRNNRLFLLNELRSKFLQFADFSLLW